MGPGKNRADKVMLTSDGDLREVQIVESDPKKVTRIGTDLDASTETQLITFLRNNADVFAWTTDDLTGIDPKVKVHNLNVDPSARPVFQKKWNYGHTYAEIVRSEVEKLLKAGHIKEIQFSDWLNNVVLVQKSPGKFRMCNDFTALNKYCPKDPYPLPRIDQLVDSTSGCALLSFMDAFQGFYQIRMARQDIKKTSFVTDGGVYCFKFMPFGLRNAGATYQRLVNTMFKTEIGKSMEVYVDDMLVKSKEVRSHVHDLSKCFATLRRYDMKLNPEKCTFGVKGGKFLGYMVTEKGIEANPEKIRAIIELPHPKTLNEAQKLVGRIMSLSRFISRSAEKNLPFFRVLKKAAKFEWSQDCKDAFEALKIYLSSPPLLSKPTQGETLYLYLAITNESISSVLVKTKDDKHLPIYYLSRVLSKPEINYSEIEKYVLCLVNTARKLKPYFQSHPIVVLTNQPLRQIFAKPETSGRMVKWTVELGEHTIDFQIPIT